MQKQLEEVSALLGAQVVESFSLAGISISKRVPFTVIANSNN